MSGQITYDYEEVREFAKKQKLMAEELIQEQRKGAQVLSEVAQESGLNSLIDASEKTSDNYKKFEKSLEEMIEVFDTVIKEANEIEELAN